jgi:hypothetical protein
MFASYAKHASVTKSIFDISDYHQQYKSRKHVNHK